jgi:CHAT domain-containing protein
MSYDGQGRYADAGPLWQRALTVYRAQLGPDHPETAFTLMGSARAQYRAGTIDGDSALALLGQAVDVFQAAPGYATFRMTAFVARAMIREQEGDLEGAIGDLDEALFLVDEQRAQVGGDEETRAAHFEGYAHLYARMVSWQLQVGDTAGAFTFAERGRARVLLDQLAAGKIDIRSSIPPDLRAPLEQREADAQAHLAEYQQRITLLQARTDIDEDERYRRIEALRDSLRMADAEYREVYAAIKNASPLWRDEITSGGRPSSLRDVQRSVVPRDGLMLSYQVGPDRSVVFVVPPSGGGLTALPLEVGDSLAAELGVTPGPLTSSVLQAILGGDTTTAATERGGLFRDLSTPARDRDRGTTVAGRAQPLDPTSLLHALWQLLIPGQLWPAVLAATEVVVIPDGPLHYLPFEALVVDTTSGAGEVTYWLDTGPPVRYAASATALANITRRPAARVVAGEGAIMLSVSNPVFDPLEVAALSRSAGDTATLGAVPAARTVYQRGGGSLARLPGTARETDIVRTAFGDAAPAQLQVLNGLDANEANLRTAVADKRFVHLATHGLVDQQRGALFASLALTPPAGETADHENDGFWQLHEIYELRLPGVELAVLSACESNIGRTVEGEGVFALSRGFTAAGAQRVVASQWSVDDASTAQLIGDFLLSVLSEDLAGRPVDYAAALRDAKRAVRSQAQWRDPYFWAPFVLSGKR